MDERQPSTHLYNKIASFHYALTELFADFIPYGKTKLIKHWFVRSASFNKYINEYHGDIGQRKDDEMSLSLAENLLECYILLTVHLGSI
jgi:hypothetical protein